MSYQRSTVRRTAVAGPWLGGGRRPDRLNGDEYNLIRNKGVLVFRPVLGPLFAFDEVNYDCPRDWAVEPRKVVNGYGLMHMSQYELKSVIECRPALKELGSIAVSEFKTSLHQILPKSTWRSMEVRVDGWSAIGDRARHAIAAVMDEESLALIYQECGLINDCIKQIAGIDSGQIVPMRDLPHISAHYLSGREVPDEVVDKHLNQAAQILPPGSLVKLGPLVIK